MAKTGSGEIMSKEGEDAPEKTEILPDDKEEPKSEKTSPDQPEEAKIQPNTPPLPETQKLRPASAAEQPKPQTPVVATPTPLPKETPKKAEPPKPQTSPAMVPKSEAVKVVPTEQVLKPALVTPGGQSTSSQTVPLAPAQKAEPAKPEEQKQGEATR
jgi:hypothetical protein